MFTQREVSLNWLIAYTFYSLFESDCYFPDSINLIDLIDYIFFCLALNWFFIQSNFFYDSFFHCPLALSNIEHLFVACTLTYIPTLLCLQWRIKNLGWLIPFSMVHQCLSNHLRFSKDLFFLFDIRFHL